MRSEYTYRLFVFLIALHATTIGCKDDRIKEQIIKNDEQMQSNDDISHSGHLEDNTEEDAPQNDNADAKSVPGDRPLKIMIKTQGDDIITFSWLHKIAVDCYDNGFYDIGAYLSCNYKESGTYVINIINKSDFDIVGLNIFSNNKSSHFVSLLSWGDFREGWSIFNGLPIDPDSLKNSDDFSIDLNVQRPFKLTYQTYKDDVNVKLNVLSVSPYLATYAVDCDGDGIFELKSKGTISSCYFRKKGKHQIALIGIIPSMRLFDHDDYSLLSIDQWGTNKWQSMHYFMAHTKNAVINAKDVPDLSHVKDMSEMFSDALKMNSDINNWDVSNVTNMQEMFSGAAAFNRPLNKWNTSNVTNMTKMFANAKKFNQNINNWDVSNVRYMSGMFFKAEKFNQLLDKWDVSKVEYMADMFAYTKYNRPLHNWNIASLLDPCGMFEYSTDDKYIEESIVYYPRDLEFIDKVYERLKSIGRECNLRYNHREDPWRYPQESDYYQFFKDDHDVYPGRF